MNIKINKRRVDQFNVLTSMLGLDQDSLWDYFNWCLLEHLVSEIARDKDWLNSIKTKPNALSLFRAKVETRTNCSWDVDNISALYGRVKLATEKHFRQPIRYEELLRLLVNSPLKCSKCGKEPPEVRLHIDHMVPSSRGGSSKFENLQFLCQNCNLKKSNKLEKSDTWLNLESLQPS